MYSQCYGNLVKFFNHKYDIWNCVSWPEIQNLDRFGLKIAMSPIFMKFDTQNKSNMLNINILIGITDLWPKITNLRNLVPKLIFFSNFYEIWHSQQIKHANCEYNTRPCLEHLRDYKLRMIICKIWLTVRTLIMALTIR